MMFASPDPSATGHLAFLGQVSNSFELVSCLCLLLLNDEASRHASSALCSYSVFLSSCSTFKRNHRTRLETLPVVPECNPHTRISVCDCVRVCSTIAYYSSVVFDFGPFCRCRCPSVGSRHVPHLSFAWWTWGFGTGRPEETLFYHWHSKWNVTSKAGKRFEIFQAPACSLFSFTIAMPGFRNWSRPSVSDSMTAYSLDWAPSASCQLPWGCPWNGQCWNFQFSLYTTQSTTTPSTTVAKAAKAAKAAKGHWAVLSRDRGLPNPHWGLDSNRSRSCESMLPPENLDLAVQSSAPPGHPVACWSIDSRCLDKNEDLPHGPVIWCKPASSQESQGHRFYSLFQI